MIRFLSLVFLIAAAPIAADEVMLPPGSKITAGGFIEDDGTIVLLSTRYGGDEGLADESTILRISPGGKAERFELPNVYGRSLRRLDNGRLLLRAVLPPPTPEDYYGVAVNRILELRAGGKVRQVWEWSEYSTDGSERVGEGGWTPFDVSHDGKLWGVLGSVPVRGAGAANWRIRGYDITLGSTRKNAVGARNARTESLRFDEVDVQWNEEYWPGWVILDSDGPVIAITWKDEDFVVHCAEKCSYTVPLFGRPEEERSVWQAADRVLWSSTKGVLRAYHLWDFGLSGRTATEPFWELERKDGWRPHSRGVVRTVEGAGSYRIEHLWREPWTGLEEHYVSDWQPGSVPSRRWVSPNGRHAAVIEPRTLEEDEGGGVAFSARNVDMRWEPRPLPPIEAAEPPAEDGTEPAKKQNPPV